MNGVDARELSDGEVEGRRQIGEYFRFLKAEVPGFEQSAIVEIAPQVGIRETRRIEGALCADGRGHPVVGALRRQHRHQRLADGAASPTGRIDWAFPRDDATTPTTSCRGACWCRSGVDNLLVAGRCASMTHEGQSAARASGGCFVMGQAAGTAAARYQGGRFADLDVAALHRVLAGDGADLDAGATGI